MQKLRFTLLSCILFSFITVKAQFTITGIVMDSSSREPLYGASVFAQNTTLGTATNKQGEFSLSLKAGGYDLVISFTGYQTQQTRIQARRVNLSFLHRSDYLLKIRIDLLWLQLFYLFHVFFAGILNGFFQGGKGKTR